MPNRGQNIRSVPVESADRANGHGDYELLHRQKPWLVTLLFLVFLVFVGLILLLSVMVNLDGEQGLQAFEEGLRSFADRVRGYVE